jgi:hypothetical protein
MIKWIGDRSHPTGREHWSVTAIGSFALRSDAGGTTELSPTTLRKAWMLLRFQHPSIAATASDDTVDYLVPDPTALAQWADETMTVVSSPGVTANELVATMKPSPFATAFFLPHTQQVVLHTAHWRTDGHGILHLLNAFFDALASVLSAGPDVDPAAALAWGDEHARLAPAVEELLGVPDTPTPAIRAAAAESLATTALAAGSVGLPWERAAQQPGGTRGVRRSVPEPATRAVLAACKARGLRLRAAVHASLAAANFLGAAGESSQQQRTEGSGGACSYYTSTMRFSLRPYIPELSDGSPQHAAGLYTGGYFARVSSAQTWQEHAAQYEALYAAGLSSQFLLARRQYAVEALGRFQTVATSAGAGAGARPAPRSEVDISTVDDAEELVAPARRIVNVYQGSGEGGGGEGVLEVRDVSLGVECLAQETYLFFWTFRGRIEFHLVYNDAFYEAADMAEILSVVERVLLKELYVE